MQILKESTLHIAAMIGDVALLHYGVQSGLDVNNSNNSSLSELRTNDPFVVGYTPIKYAVAFAHYELVTELLGLGADPNLCPAGQEAPLYFAARYRDTRIAMALLNAGADVNYQTYERLSALSVAVTFGNFEMVRLLLSKGADPNLPAYDSSLLDKAKRLYVRDFEEFKQFPKRYPDMEQQMIDFHERELTERGEIVQTLVDACSIVPD